MAGVPHQHASARGPEELKQGERRTKTESKSWVIESVLNNTDVITALFSSRLVHKEKPISNTTPAPRSV